MPGDLLSIVSDLIVVLTGDRPGIETIDMAAVKKGEALGDRRILLIVDVPGLARSATVFRRVAIGCERGNRGSLGWDWESLVAPAAQDSD